MNLSKIGEFQLISQLFGEAAKSGNPSPLGTGFEVRQNIGDDCAVIERGDEAWLLSTDLLVEGVHFRRDWSSAEDIGHKALAVNLSDIAACGGQAAHVFLSMALPQDTELSWIQSFARSFLNLAKATGVTLIGGDTARSPRDLFFNVAVWGSAQRNSVKLRSHAKAGDVLCTTATLGDAGAGLRILQQGLPINTPEREALCQAHRRPRAAIEEGLWLGQRPEVRGMMDLSDGLASDLDRLTEASGTRAMVQTGDLVPSPALQKFCSSEKINPLELMIGGGEDHSLLSSVDASAYPRLAQDFLVRFGRPLQKIGQLSNDVGANQYLDAQNKAINVSAWTFRHFS